VSRSIIWESFAEIGPLVLWLISDAVTNADATPSSVVSSYGFRMSVSSSIKVLLWVRVPPCCKLLDRVQLNRLKVFTKMFLT
jgi:hypothetical protein